MVASDAMIAALSSRAFECDKSTPHNLKMKWMPPFVSLKPRKDAVVDTGRLRADVPDSVLVEPLL
jgi:hypothetical protein